MLRLSRTLGPARREAFSQGPQQGEETDKASSEAHARTFRGNCLKLAWIFCRQYQVLLLALTTIIVFKHDTFK